LEQQREGAMVFSHPQTAELPASTGINRTLTIVFALCVLLQGCAVVNPDLDATTRAFDVALASGNCDEARKMVEAAANRGEPWAEFRLGEALVDSRCRIRLPFKESIRSLEDGMRWYIKAACFESASDWEGGSALSNGPTGFFNSRASSTDAALELSSYYLIGRRRDVAWFFIEHARSQYAMNEEVPYDLLARLKMMRLQLTPWELKEIQDNMIDLCSAPRPPWYR